jgi:hypothetical protein
MSEKARQMDQMMNFFAVSKTKEKSPGAGIVEKPATSISKKAQKISRQTVSPSAAEQQMPARVSSISLQLDDGDEWEEF